MITFLEGIIDSVNINYLTLNLAGIGYKINIPTYDNLLLKAGDKILRIDDVKSNSQEKVITYLQEKKVNDIVQLEIERKEKIEVVDIKLKPIPGDVHVSLESLVLAGRHLPEASNFERLHNIYGAQLLKHLRRAPNNRTQQGYLSSNKG